MGFRTPRQITVDTAQQEIMHAISNAILIAEESNINDDIIREMVKQGKRVGKLFGFANWHGIY